MKLNNFHYALSLMQTLYGINTQEDEFEEIALVAWGLIGNKRTRLYRYSVCVKECEHGIQLPCNVDIIEAVTTGPEEWDYSTNYSDNGDFESFSTEQYIEGRKMFRHPLYIEGKFIKYEQVGDMLYFDRPYGKINILYKGEILDDDGLPQITDKEASAIATYCAYVIKYREGLQTNNNNIIQLAETLKQKWNIQVDQARVDHYMSQNEWDQVLDARSSWARKQHHKSHKIYW